MDKATRHRCGARTIPRWVKMRAQAEQVRFSPGRIDKCVTRLRPRSHALRLDGLQHRVGNGGRSRYGEEFAAGANAHSFLPTIASCVNPDNRPPPEISRIGAYYRAKAFASQGWRSVSYRRISARSATPSAACSRRRWVIRAARPHPAPQGCQRLCRG